MSWAAYASWKAFYPLWLSFWTTFNVPNFFAQYSCNTIFFTETDQYKNSNCIVLESCRNLNFFLCICICLAKRLSKFHSPSLNMYFWFGRLWKRPHWSDANRKNMDSVKTKLACLGSWKRYLWGTVPLPSTCHVLSHHLLLKRYHNIFVFFNFSIFSDTGFQEAADCNCLNVEVVIT